jgi:NADH dehydrogenase
MARVFVTGASGFAGTTVCRVLRARGHTVTTLQRGEAAEAGAVRGDLLQPATYAAALANLDIIVHLAAVTGKAPPAEYVRVNIDGTKALLEAARRSGVRRFLFCSSIAVTFPDQRRYYYAASKAAAERLVAGAPLAATVIRPTIVAGRGSPVMSRLRALANLPVVPVIGGRVRLQPILVDDLAEFIADVVESDRLDGQTLELGGPEVITVRELFERLRRNAGGGRPRFVPIPLSLALPGLTLLERVAYRALPITVGQLATFRFDGVARPNALWELRRERLASIDRMVASDRAS